MQRKVTMNEMMGRCAEGKGSDGDKFELDELKELLGEKMPTLEFTPVGRLRLVNALRHRFGDTYRNLPGIRSLLKEFDTQSDFEIKLQEMKMIKARGRK